ncbi:MAG: O-methyltransferase [Candidatus Coproplasma sp.]
MENFTYAHNDTSTPERSSRTAGLNKLKVSREVEEIRRYAFERDIPVASDETLGFLITLARAKGAENILEVGCAIGATSLALLQSCKGSRLTAIERDENFYAQALNNLKNYSERANLLFGDAAQTLATLSGEFDFIFLDCAKVQYIKLLPRLKELLAVGGVLVADDVLLYGYVNGEVPVPKKRAALVRHVREYLDAVTDDEELSTCVLDVGDGVSVSVKK